jgi:superfamily II DNA or RNA helicase
MIELRPYQEKAINLVLNELTASNSVLLQMPTGTGKTTVFASLVYKWIASIEPKKRVLILVHRKELVDQILDRLKKFGIIAGRIQSGHEHNLIKQIQVGLIQSLNKQEKLPKNISLIIIDEAHHTPANRYRSILKHYSKDAPKLFGLTATPYRLSGEGFNDLYDILVTSDSIKTFISNGYLSKIKHLSTTNIDLTKIKIDYRKKDFVEKELEPLIRSDKVMADLVESYLKYAKDKKAIVFALNKTHSKDIVDRYNKIGIKAEYIDSDTPKTERDKIVDDFKKGSIKVLANVNIFTEGFDCPDVEVVQLARPTKSFGLYLQQVGRVMRPHDNKSYGLILDNACLWKEHGLITQDIVWKLTGNPELLADKGQKNLQVDEDGFIYETFIPDEVQGVEFEEISDPIEDIKIENENNLIDINGDSNKIIKNKPEVFITDYYNKENIIKIESIRLSKLAAQLKMGVGFIVNTACLFDKKAIDKNPNSKVNNVIIDFLVYLSQNNLNKLNKDFPKNNKLLFHVFSDLFNVYGELKRSLIKEGNEWLNIITILISKRGKINSIFGLNDSDLFQCLGIENITELPKDRNKLMMLVFYIETCFENYRSLSYFNKYANEKNSLFYYYKELEFIRNNCKDLNSFIESSKAHLLNYPELGKIIQESTLTKIYNREFNFLNINQQYKKIIDSIKNKIALKNLEFQPIDL